jgi:hypothetical protein
MTMFLGRDSDGDGIPDIVERIAHEAENFGSHTVIGTGETITTSDEPQGPRRNPPPGGQNID